MAKYDRRLLVPYLEDLCSVEMAYEKIRKDAGWSEFQVGVYQSKLKEIKDTLPPELMDIQGDKGTMGIGIGGYNLILGAVLWLVFGRLWPNSLATISNSTTSPRVVTAHSSRL